MDILRGSGDGEWMRAKVAKQSATGAVRLEYDDRREETVDLAMEEYRWVGNFLIFVLLDLSTDISESGNCHCFCGLLVLLKFRFPFQLGVSPVRDTVWFSVTIAG